MHLKSGSYFFILLFSPGDGGAVRSASLALFAHCTDELLLLVSASAAPFVCVLLMAGRCCLVSVAFVIDVAFSA